MMTFDPQEKSPRMCLCCQQVWVSCPCSGEMAGGVCEFHGIDQEDDGELDERPTCQRDAREDYKAEFFESIAALNRNS